MAIDERWKSTMDSALKSANAADHDAIIHAEIAGYNARFGTTANFPQLDWRLFKAILFVESGGPGNPAWKHRVMQIGNKGDPAAGTLRRGGEHSDLIMSETLRHDIKTKGIGSPAMNIRAGIAWILTKAALVTQVSRPSDKDTALHKHIVRKKDSLGHIALIEHTTLAELDANNLDINAKPLRVGNRVYFHRARMVWEISLWQKIDEDFVADKYNGGGDPDYAEKLRYVESHL